MSGEFLWQTRSKISKSDRLSYSPSASTRMACPFALKFCTEFQKTLLYKSVSAFFIIVSCFFIFKRISLIQSNWFLWKIFNDDYYCGSFVFTFTFQILFDLVLHLLFYIVFVLLYLLSFLTLFNHNLLSQKCRIETNSSIFCPLHINENTF